MEEKIIKILEMVQMKKNGAVEFTEESKKTDLTEDELALAHKKYVN